MGELGRQGGGAQAVSGGQAGHACHVPDLRQASHPRLLVRKCWRS